MFTRVLVANRGAIAHRIIRTLRRLGVVAIGVYSDADIDSLHVAAADVAERLGPAPARDSYLNADAILEAARRTGAEAIHPGYGFLSENADFAERCEAAGIAFIGPTPDSIRLFGLKHTARATAEAAGLPVLAGSGLLADAEAAAAAAQRTGFPVMLKATAGGGGIGMRACESADELHAAFEAVARLGGQNFGHGGVFVERLVRTARHVEVQVFGDGSGRVLALGERDCSLQRRNQKVVEETPAPHVPAAVRAAMHAAAVRLMAAVRYRSAGTVEFLYDADREQFFFLEVNTRLQVEHGVTEQVTGVDLVEWMVRVAGGDAACLDNWPGTARGASIEARVYAEDPSRDYQPSVGLLTRVQWPAGVRVETWVTDGVAIGPHYDPMLAKLIVSADTRAAAVQALGRALDETHLAGIETNVEWLRSVARSEAFVSGRVSTRTLADVRFAPTGIRVVAGGLATTVQGYPGRLGYWDVGVPPSGPMDALALRLANRLLANTEDAAGLEITAMGPTLTFEVGAVICLAGADMDAEVSGRPVAPYVPTRLGSGETLRMGRARGAGLRAYLAVAGGIDVPPYLGSPATFTLGGFGGHAGRALAAGDVLRIGTPSPQACGGPLDPALRPALGREWTLQALVGPQAAPDFFTAGAIETFFAATWRVHYHSNRTGIRLVGPKPDWARRDGGEAGLHPSNLHDNAYAIGAVDFTGDMPIILGPDGPSLGGFVCPCVVTRADLWKLGQLAPGDAVRFEQTDAASAAAAAAGQDEQVARLGAPRARRVSGVPAAAVLAELPAAGRRPTVVYRRQGDQNVLVEYGPMVLDLELRIRVHALMLELQQQALPGIIDITPGIRSLQVHFDDRRLTTTGLVEALSRLEDRLGALDDFEIPSRVVHLPLSWRDPAVEQTIRRYMASVRDDAPWCPDNIEFIRRINGLASTEDVRRIVFDARYLVMGLGDVYLGAPVATPLDPRHRLVTTKYNPARTWTPPNVVGIGGAYLCIYGMEGPGGYQLFGRTIQVWNTHRQTGVFEPGKPWLLRFFDQIRFFEVSAEELLDWRRDFPAGRRQPVMDPEVFRLSDYRRFLAQEQPSIAAFEATRRAAFDAERHRWDASREFDRIEAATAAAERDAAPVAIDLPPGAELVEAPFGGSIVKIRVEVGEHVAKGATLVVIEAMKAECTVAAPAAGVVRRLCAAERESVVPGSALIVLERTDG